MKKILSLVMLSCITLASFASPWDLKNYTAEKEHSWVKPARKMVYSDPWVRIYAAYDLQFGTYYHRVRVDVEFNQSVGIPYYATIRVYGDFYSTGEYFREYTLYLSGSQFYKSQEYPLLWNEEVYTEVTELVDYGPQ